MVFSSNLFLFTYLPAVVLLHLLLPARFRNAALFAASLAFYVWGSGPIVFVLLGSIFFNFYVARAIDRHPEKAQVLYSFGIIFNLALLFYFKYFNFFYGEMQKLLALYGASMPAHASVALPIGISFFTFQAISYLGEIRRKEQSPARTIIDYGMYISLFPHLIAGPIVRFSNISREIRSRIVGIDDLFEGMWRFTLGLGKKVLIANRVGAVADQIFALPQTNLTAGFAWIGIAAYTMQIYYDFSGYSDMAIGLARMLGFHFPENFDQPYRACSVTEFWRRWHMTLSRWFRDFVYIPLGGNRHGPFRTYLNLWIVFFLCGLWHGAAWNFVVWGLYHGLLLVIERAAAGRFDFASRGMFGSVRTMVLIMFGWVLFRAPSLGSAVEYMRAMIHVNAAQQGFYTWTFFLQCDFLIAMTAACFFAWLPIERCPKLSGSLPLVLARSSVALVLFVISAAALSTAAFNPFIYFRF